jgi:hypothetical protein
MCGLRLQWQRGGGTRVRLGGKTPSFVPCVDSTGSWQQLMMSCQLSCYGSCRAGRPAK